MRMRLVATPLIAEGEGDTIYIDGMKGEFAMDVVGDDVVLIANGIEITLQDQFAEDATSIFAELIFEDMPLILDPDAVDPTDPNQIGVLIGDSGDNVLEWAWDGGPVNIEGLGGNDLLIAGFSDDMLSGGEGNDFINGGSGDDELHGGQGDDILVGESGSDTLYGGAGSDVYAYNASYASFFDMAGMDEPEVLEGLESEWDIVSDNVDTIVDTEGELDVLLLTYFNPGASPFDNYFDILEITEEGDLEYSMGASEHSSNHLQYGLYEDWEYSPSFDHTYKTVDPETGEESWVTDEAVQANDAGIANFNLADITTYPGYAHFSEVTDTSYDPSSFSLDDPNTWPSDADLPFMSVINENLINLSDIEDDIASGDESHSGVGAEFGIAPESQGGGLDTGFVVEGFASGGDTIEALYLANEGPFSDAVDKYMESGGASAGVIDAMMAQGLGTLYNLNPDGVVANQDASFQSVSYKTAYLLPDGSVVTKKPKKGEYEEIEVPSYSSDNGYDGQDTNANFFLVANQANAGLNEHGLGWSEENGVQWGLTSDNADYLSIDSNEILVSGAAAHDIVFGTNDDAYADMLLGWGGSDWLQGYGGENLLIGGAGGDKFVVDNLEQHTVIYGTYKSVDLDNPFETDVVHFDFGFDSDEIRKETVVDENGVIKTAFIVEHDLGGGETAYIELYDIEEAHFYENGEVTIKTLTDGNVYVFDSVTYNENVKFHVYQDEQGVAQIEVTNDKGKKGIDTLFEGAATEVDEFVFADGVTVNVSNVSETNVLGQATAQSDFWGTDGIDLIIGDDNDNLIYAGGGDDIIFGFGGDDTIVGGFGDDVIVGGKGADLIDGDNDYFGAGAFEYYLDNKPENYSSDWGTGATSSSSAAAVSESLGTSSVDSVQLLSLIHERLQW